MHMTIGVLGRNRLFAVLVLVVFSLPVMALASDRSPLDIVTDTGTHRFDVELALTGNQRSVGLMFRKSMDEGTGMLFRFDRPQRATMWMKNTFIPLDMVFIRTDGTVADLHRGAEPHSEAIIRSSEPVLYVLELNAGVADKIELQPGNRIVHPIIQSN